MNGIHIRKGYLPGAIGRVVELHGCYYSRHWGFGSFFEAKVAREIALFMDSYDDQRDGLWTAAIEDRVQGAIVIDGAHAEGQGAHLRWFVVSERLQGQGIGGRLIGEAMAFCRSRGYARVYLWTFEGLHAAHRLYEKAGFELVVQQEGRQWGREVNEQQWVLQVHGV